MLLDLELGEERFFVLPPPMAGFFEFSMMRVGNGYDQKLLAELYYQYLNVEEDFREGPPLSRGDPHGAGLRERERTGQRRGPTGDGLRTGPPKRSAPPPI